MTPSDLAATGVALELPASGRPNSFGAGGAEPYESALLAGGPGLRLIAQSGRSPLSKQHVALERFLRPADLTDRRLLSRARGSVLDIGCGPGRMVRAGIEAGFPAVGVDVSSAAVGLAIGAGLPVLCASVFELDGRSDRWSSLLLLDGNVGIGGDPARLLRQCLDLLADGGNVLAEVHRDRRRDVAFQAVLSNRFGDVSDPFPWAEVGAGGLRAHLAAVGLRVVEEWLDGGRAFVELERR